jgi:hypothetical protein
VPFQTSHFESTAGLKFLSDEEVDALLEGIKADKEAADAQRRGGGGGATASSAAGGGS